MLIQRFVWFNRGLRAFGDEVNKRIANGCEVQMLPPQRSLLGFRWLCTAIVAESRPTFAAVKEPASPEELRAAIVAGIDELFRQPRIVLNRIPEEAKRMLKAQQQYWRDADASDCAHMLELYKVQN